MARILFINRTVPDLTKEQVIGKSIYDYTPPEFHVVAAECLGRVLETGKPGLYHTEYRTAEGERAYFEVRIGPIFRSGQVVAFISSSNEVTERVQMQEALQRERDFIAAVKASSAAVGVAAFDPT